MSLSDADRSVLEFEGAWANRPQRSGAKESAIWEAFGVSATRHYQRVLRLLDDPEAVAHAPLTVARLRRLLAQRSR